MHDFVDICLALAIVLLSGAELLDIQPLAVFGGFIAAFHFLFHVSIGGVLVYRRIWK